MKSFSDAAQIKDAKIQAAQYAKETGLLAVTIALFIQSDYESVLEKLSGDYDIEGVRVTVFAIGWK